MPKTDITALNVKSISVDGVSVPGSPAAMGPFTTFDQIDADTVLALNGVVLFGTLPPGAIYTNFDNLNVESGVSVAEQIRYGIPFGIPPLALALLAGDVLTFSDGSYLEFSA